MAVRTVRTNHRRIGESASLQRRALPQLLSGAKRIGIAQGRGPRLRILAREDVRVEDLARIGGEQIEVDHAKTADEPVGAVESKPNRIASADDGAGRQCERETERREAAANSAEIGRASCRESVEIWVMAASVRQRESKR